MATKDIAPTGTDTLFEKISTLIEESRKKVLEDLSDRLTGKFGPSWSVDTLKRCRYFFTVYSCPQIGATVLPKSRKQTAVSNLGNSLRTEPPQQLSEK